MSITSCRRSLYLKKENKIILFCVLYIRLLSTFQNLFFFLVFFCEDDKYACTSGIKKYSILCTVILFDLHLFRCNNYSILFAIVLGAKLCLDILNVRFSTSSRFFLVIDLYLEISDFKGY